MEYPSPSTKSTALSRAFRAKKRCPSLEAQLKLNCVDNFSIDSHPPSPSALRPYAAAVLGWNTSAQHVPDLGSGQDLQLGQFHESAMREDFGPRALSALKVPIESRALDPQSSVLSRRVLTADAPGAQNPPAKSPTTARRTPSPGTPVRSPTKPLIRKTVYGGSNPSAQTGAPAGGRQWNGPPSRQIGAPGTKQPAGPILRRTRPPPSQGPLGAAGRAGQRPPGPLLRRTSGPRTNTPGQWRGSPQAAGGPQANRSGQRFQRNRRERIRAAPDEQDEDLGLAALAEMHIKTVADAPANPTEEIVHVPGQDMSIDELRADWPNTPLSATGLTESVQQRIEWLAHRIPHGYETTGQLAERYYKGYFTRFESEQEKDEVLARAAEMARARADQITERKHVEVEPIDMSFEDVVSRPGERHGLADKFVQGKYPELEKQKMPFLDQIARNLNNNATYKGGETEQFMQAVQKLMGTQGGQTTKGA